MLRNEASRCACTVIVDSIDLCFVFDRMKFGLHRVIRFEVTCVESLHVEI